MPATLARPPLRRMIRPANPFAQGLIGCWTFREGAGTAIGDVSRNIHLGAGNITGANWSWGDGPWNANGPGAGGALVLGGTDSYATVPIAGSALLAPQSFTIEAWVKVASVAAGSFGTLLARAGADYRILAGAASGHWQVDVTGRLSAGAKDTTLAWTAGAWQHVVLRSVPGETAFFANGVKAIFDTGSGAVTYTTNGTLTFGARQNGLFLNGSIASVRMWERKLDDAEVEALYADPWLLWARRSATIDFAALAGTPPGSAALASVATLTASGTATAAGSAAPAAASTLAASGSASATGSAALASVATLAAVGGTGGGTSLASQNWDGVTAPAVPAGWAFPDGPGATTTSQSASAPNSLTIPASGASNNTTAICTTSAGTADVAVSAAFRMDSAASGANVNFILLGRYGSTATGFGAATCYAAEVVYTTAGQINLYLFAGVAGSYTTLAGPTDRSAALGVGAWYTATLQCLGTTISLRIQRKSDGLWLNGTGSWVSAQADALSVTDSSVASGNYAGVGWFTVAPATYAGAVHFDDFVLAAAGTTPPPPPADRPLAGAWIPKTTSSQYANLVAWFPLQERGQADAKDYGPNGLVAACATQFPANLVDATDPHFGDVFQGDPDATTTATQVGRYYRLPLAQATALNFGTGTPRPFSISGWFNTLGNGPPANDWYALVADQGPSPFPGYGWSFDSSGSIHIYVNGPTATGTYKMPLTGGLTPFDGLWHHVLWSHNPVSSTSGINTYYFDGVLVGSLDVGCSVGPFTSDWMIAGDGGLDPYFVGQLADLRVYSGVLGASDATALHDPATRWDLYQPITVLASVATLTASGTATAVGSSSLASIATLAASGASAASGSAALASVATLAAAGSGSASGSAALGSVVTLAASGSSGGGASLGCVATLTASGTATAPGASDLASVATLAAAGTATAAGSASLASVATLAVTTAAPGPPPTDLIDALLVLLAATPAVVAGLPGGIWTDVPAIGTPTPYLQVLNADRHSRWTPGTTGRGHSAGLLQFDVYAEDPGDGSFNPKDRARDLTWTLADSLAGARPTFARGRLTGFLRKTDPVDMGRDPSPGPLGNPLYRSMITFHYFVSREG